jgi:uncharacterized protein
MYFSKYNIVSQIRNSDESFIVNLLSGHADILSKEEVQKLSSGGVDDIAEFLTKGYLADEQQEKSVYRKKYIDFLQEREIDEMQLFFVMNYSCNFACSYCYQGEYIPAKGMATTEIIDAFFDFIGKEHAGRNKYITLFGGEPLMPGEAQKKLVGYFVDKCKAHSIPLALVTNGFELEDYLGILGRADIKEIQVTLDGPAEVHDGRRMLHGGKPTFEKIIRGIDAALSQNMPVNLRMIVDKDNIAFLPALADIAIEKGWTKHPNFKTQLGRNYELHSCQENQKALFSRMEMYEDIYQLLKQHPQIIEFHKPAFSISKFLSENGELPSPLFDACPACKTEWAFDYTGQIYSCTATVGKAGEELGTFWPEVSLHKERIEAWQERDVLNIPECRNCNLQLACGGGCGSVAKNKAGHCNSPDCRPVKELMELGFSYYFK